MSEQEVKQAIESALKGFSSQPVAEAATHLLGVIGYTSKKLLSLQPNTLAGFLSTFSHGRTLNDRYALPGEWKTIDFLFQVTDDEIRAAGSQKFDFKSKGAYSGTIINSYLFFALELKSSRYSRTALAGITREVNKLFDMPALILFRHGETLTLAIINRRLHKREAGKDVLEKVTLVQDIRCVNTHRAHVEILFDLSLGALHDRHGFTNFVELHGAWQKTLDTSALNKRFYQELANWYFWALTQARFPRHAPKDADGLDSLSLIRLITRVIFCWFLKEKGLLPSALFDQRRLAALLNDLSPKESTYYKAILQNLFFATLNQEMDKREFRKDGQHFMAHNLYRYRSLLKDSTETLVLLSAIPFMNGGLFECLDKSIGTKEKPEYLRVDGFSDRNDNSLKVPNELFFGGERVVDLSGAYGDSRYKSARVEGLIRVLDRYKFTIAENTPIEEEVALDPELLGKVFENLLAAYNPETGATARKQTGSFYTPRGIVNYMVDESLIASLKTKLDAAGHDSATAEDRLRRLFVYNDRPHEFTTAEVDAIIEAIDNLKILDPACGSGAFPMGVLHKLVFVLGKLDPGNERWKARQIAKTTDPLIREQADRVFRENYEDYGRKLYLIENCIYGVDIQPIAVQIAKLRFFISLVVEQKVNTKADNLGIRPLPNLETRFVAANTLIGIERPGQQLLRNLEIDEKESELRRVRERHFLARTPPTKAKCREQDARLRSEIAELLKNDGWDTATARKLSSWDPYDQNSFAEFFEPEWMFGITNGFDICIGNPPYGPVNKRQNKAEAIVVTEEQLQYFKSNPGYAPAQGGMLNVYRLFIVKSLQLLADKGTFSEIFPLAFVGDCSASDLRRWVLDNCRVQFIEAFPERDNLNKRVFEAAKMSVCILNVQRSRAPGHKFSLRVHRDRFVDERNSKTMLSKEQIQLLDKTNLTIPILSAPEFELLTKIYSASSRIGDLGHCYTGEIDLTLGKAYISKNSNDAPLLRGAIIDRYTVRREMSQGEFLYLKAAKYKAEVSGKKASHFKTERLAMQGITGVNERVRLKMTMIPANVFCANSVNYVHFTDQQVNPKFILGILNSRLLNWVFGKFSTNSNVNGYEVDNLPVPVKAGPSLRNEIASLVDQVLASKKRSPGSDTSATECRVDEIVYRLYALTPDEIRLVEASV
jgi:Alw26I/Eco31I/Esp3I family type II restriction m6 adenine DNA methyltransferase